MTAQVHTLLSQLEGLGCRLYLDGEHLKLDAPRGVVTPVIQGEIRALKPELIKYLKAHSGTHSFIPEVDKKETYPVSLGQRRLWILSQFENASISYNVPITITLNGNYDPDSFQKAINAVIDRHEILRTVFVLDENNEPRQKVLSREELDFQLQYKDYRGRDDNESRIHKENYEDSLRPFDLEKGPILRAVLTQLEDDRFIFYYNMHHIISDGWSMDVLASDLFVYYEHFKNGASLNLPDLRIHYKDYTQWQLDQLERPNFQQHRTYWLNTLHGDLPLLEFSSQQMRPKVKTYNGRSLGMYLPKELSSQLKTYSRSYGGSLYMSLVAIWKVLCYKYTSQRDIIIGSPIAGRDHPDLENQIGFYVNTLVLRNEIDPADTFFSFCKRVAANTLEAYSHQEYPFDRLVEDLDMERDMSRTPIYDVAITMQESRSSLQQPEPSISRDESIIDYGDAPSKFEIHLTFEERAGNVHFNVVYNTDVYERGLIEQLMGHFRALLTAVIRDPKSEIRDIDYLNRKEKTELISSFNSAGVSYPSASTIVSLFDEQVKKYTERTAVVFEETALTYSQLDERSNQLAHFLREKGIDKETFVPLCLDRSADMIIGILGILKAGGVYVPVTPETPKDRLLFIAEDTRAKVILGHQAHKELFSGLDFVALDQFDYSNYENTPLDLSIVPSQLAYVIYTSGTTGKPKGVLIPHKNVVRLFFNDADLFDFSSEDVWCMFHSYSFDFSVWEMYGALLFGGKLVIVPGPATKDPELFSELLQKQGVTVLNQTPSFFRILQQKILETPDYPSAIRYIIFGGEKLKPSLLKGWHERYPECKLINMYGITETTVHVTYKEITQREIASGVSNIGIPIPTLGSIILDTDQNLVPVNVSGELYIYGDGVARGYLNRDELTAERFLMLDIPNIGPTKCYRTGDLVRILDNGELEYLGRIDTQIKIRGFRIELGEIESAVLAKPSIREAAIIVDTKAEENRLIAYFISEEEETVASMQQYLSKKLPEYMLPSYYVQVKAFPLTPNGKLDRKALPSPKELELSTGVGYTAPRDKTEEKIAGIWERILGRNKVGVKDSYFALGGDSIKAISVIIEMNKILPVTIGVADLYLHPTIDELSAHISTLGNSGEATNLSEGYQQIRDLQQLIETENEEKKLLPSNYDAVYPMVPIEEGMIYSSLLRTDEPIYLDRFVYSVTIEDIDRLKVAMKTLIDRHPILRTQYFMEQFSQPVKVVLSYAEVPMTFLDFSSLPDEEVAARLQRIKEEDLNYRYKFDGQLLYNFKFVRVTGQQYIVVWNFHHAILDGWSTSVFIQELTVLLSDTEDTQLPKLNYSYLDYCAGVLSRKSSQKTTEYWQKLLSGYTRNKLPFNFKGVKISDEIGMTTVTRIVEEPVLRKLEELTEQLQVSFKAICLAAHAYLLKIICSEEDVVTGVVSHERPELERSDRIMGCFLNTVPMRVNFKDIKDVPSLIMNVNDYLIESKQHEVHVSHIARSIGEKATLENPIFDTILNYTHFHVYEEAASDSGIDNAQATVDDALMVSDEMTNTLFDVEVSRRSNGLELRIKYVPSLFSSEDALAGLQLFANILNLFVEQETLSTQLVMEKSEFDELVYEYNDTIVEEDRNVLMHQLFEEQVRITPDNAALIQDGKELSYRELNERANEVAHHLIALGVCAETNVGVLCTRSFDMIIALMGILKSGGSYVPVDPEYPLQRQQYIVENSRVNLILIDKQQALSNTMPQKEFLMVSDLVNDGDSSNPPVRTAGDKLAYTIYTSGSTGNPKGVMIEHYSAVNLIRWVNERFNISETDRLLFITSVCFDLSVYDIFGMLATGGSVVIARKEEVQNFDLLKQLLIEEQITFWDSVPTTFNYLVDELEEEKADQLLPDLRLVFMSGDWIPVQLPNRARKYFPNAEIISLGGATEGTVWSNYYPIDAVGAHWSSIPYGKPMRNNFFYVLDDQLCPVPKGTVGELFIGGIGVARGYDNDPKKTKAAFMPDPFNKSMGGRMYKTGDLGRWMRNGNMEFIGRKDNQVKIRGFRVELGEIESTLSKHPAIKEAIVSAVVNKKGQNQLCAYLVVTSEYNNEQLKQYLKERLPDYMIPGFYMLLDGLPLNSNGKIDRKALPDVSQAMTADSAKYVAPNTDTQKRIAGIVSRIIDTDTISIESNFFDLGFNSLSLMRMANALRKEFEVDIQIVTFFENSNISELETFINKQQIQSELENAEADFMASAATALNPIKVAENKENYPLSNAQRRLWVLSQFEDVSVAYNLSFLYQLPEGTDVDRFKKAIYSVVDRHEILRTVFAEDQNGEVRQWIRTIEELNFEVIDVDLTSESNAEQLLHAFDRRETAKPFDLSKCLIRATMLKTSENRSFLYFKVHHIISDEWSVEVLIRNVLRFYSEENTAAIPKLPIQYKDYTEWQLQQLRENAFNEHRDYWLATLQGPLPLFEIPTQQKRPVVKTSNGAAITSFIGKEQSAQLKEFTHRNGGTLFMAVLASLKVLLYRYSGQDDIIIGSPVAGRSTMELEDQIGFYANTLVLRNSVNPLENFQEFFAQVRENTLESYKHQLYPFDRLVEDLELPHDTSRSAIFDVMLTLQNRNFIGMTDEVDESMIDEIRYSGARASKFDLAFSVSEIGDYLTFNVEYNTDIYDRELIENIIKSYRLLLTKLFEDVHRPIGAIELTSEKEKRKILHRFNETEVAYPKGSVLELFAAQVESRPRATALVFGEKQLTYKQLDSAVNRFANYLSNVHAVENGDFVGIQVKRSDSMIIAILAVLKLGGAYVPIDSGYPENRKNFIIKDSDCKICIDESHFHEFERHSDEFENKLECPKYDPKSLAYMIYTSGTTGNPKGVMISREALYNYVQYAGNAYIKDELSQFVLFTSISFDLTVTSIFTPLCFGGSIRILPSFEHEIEVLELVKNEEFDVVKLTPSHIDILLNKFISEEKTYKGISQKTFIVGGEALSRETVQKLFKFYRDRVTIWNEYGPTENTVGCISAIIEDEPDAVVSIGRPTPNVKAYVLDDFKNTVPVGIPGELYLGGTQLASGYLKRDELTRDAFVENPFEDKSVLYKTGDLVRWNEDGTLEYLGRKDEQVKIRGHRIELGEIEAAIKSVSNLDQVVVAMREVDDEPALVAYYVSTVTTDKQKLRDKLRTVLPDYMVPNYFKAVEGIPLTSNGKIDKRFLPELSEGDRIQTAYVAPRNELEKRLTQIWKEILGLKKVGVLSNFFELGGHSLKATRLISRYNEAFGVKIKIRELFLHTTIRAHALLLESTSKSNYIPIPRVKKAADYPVSDAQRRLWIASQYENGSEAYNMPAQFTLQRDIDLSLFEQAIHAVIERHEILRTQFVETEEGELRQRILPLKAVDFKVEQLDFSQMNHAVEAVQDYIDRDKYQPFDLANGPLMRVAILRVSAADYICYYNIHHIIGDGWSIEVLARDLMAQYELLKVDPRAVLPPLPIQFKDYVGWLPGYKQKHFDELQEYWGNLFTGPPPKLELAISGERPALKTYNGGMFVREIDVELTHALMRMGNQNDSSLFMNLLSLVGVLLYRHSYQNEIVIGSPVSGRIHNDLQDQIGCYVNTVALLLELHEDKAFSEYTSEVKERVLQAYDHQMYPFDALVDELNIPKDLSRSPMFDVMVVMNQNMDTVGEDVSPAADPLPEATSEVIKSKYDITFYFSTSGGQVICTMVYNSDLFEASAIGKLWADFHQLVEAVIADNQLKIKDYCDLLLDEQERAEQHSFSEGITTSINEDF